MKTEGRLSSSFGREREERAGAEVNETNRSPLGPLPPPPPREGAIDELEIPGVRGAVEKRGPVLLKSAKEEGEGGRERGVSSRG